MKARKKPRKQNKHFNFVENPDLHKHADRLVLSAKVHRTLTRTRSHGSSEHSEKKKNRLMLLLSAHYVYVIFISVTFVGPSTPPSHPLFLCYLFFQFNIFRRITFPAVHARFRQIEKNFRNISKWRKLHFACAAVAAFSIFHIIYILC